MRRFMKWLGLLGCVSLLLAWAVSLPWQIGYDPPSGGVFGALIDGFVIVGHVTGPGTGLKPNWYVAEAKGPRHDWGFAAPERIQLRSGNGVLIPLWLPFVIIAITTTFLFWQDRKSPNPGHCVNCGYDLTGNTSGRCPECGKGK